MKDAGVAIVNFDAAVYDLDQVDCFVATDNVLAGEIIGEKVMADFPDGAKVAVLNFPANTACNDREVGFLKAIEGSNIEVVCTFDTEGSTEKAMSLTEDILQANPDLDAIFCINDECGETSYAALRASNSNVWLYSVNGGPESKPNIADDLNWRATSTQSPITIGKEMANAAYTILEGGTPEHEIYVTSFLIDINNVNDYLDGWQ